jgi:hypothetical protein
VTKGISFSDLDETQGNRTRNSLKDAFDELQVLFNLPFFVWINCTQRKQGTPKRRTVTKGKLIRKLHAIFFLPIEYHNRWKQ